MSDLMTWQEIEETFDSEWVLIEDPEYDSRKEITSGKVLYHSPEWRQVQRKSDALDPANADVVYVCKEPVVYLLNWGLPGAYGIYDWSEAGSGQSVEREDAPDSGQ